MIFRRRFEVADGAAFCHSQQLTDRHASFNQVCSDKTDGYDLLGLAGFLGPDRLFHRDLVERVHRHLDAGKIDAESVRLHAHLPDALASGALDIAIYEVAHPQPGLDVLRRERTCWMMSRHHDLLSRDPLPIALFDRDCWWRDAALEALHAAGRPFRIAYSSQSVAGVAAALEAGIAVGLLGETSMTEDLRQIGPDEGFGDMPVSSLILGLRPGATTPQIHAMKTAIQRAFGVT